MVDFDKYIKTKLEQNPDLNQIFQEANRAAKIAHQIYYLRKEKGLTQNQLANKIGISQSNIARIENADYTHYTLSTLLKVAKALDADLSIFITSPEQTNKLVNAYLEFAIGYKLYASSKTSLHEKSTWIDNIEDINPNKHFRSVETSSETKNSMFAIC